jgi:hypothetical protein
MTPDPVIGERFGSVSVRTPDDSLTIPFQNFKPNFETPGEPERLRLILLKKLLKLPCIADSQHSRIGWQDA